MKGTDTEDAGVSREGHTDVIPQAARERLVGLFRSYLFFVGLFAVALYVVWGYETVRLDTLLLACALLMVVLAVADKLVAPAVERMIAVLKQV